MKAVVYCRVSSKEQEETGYSLDAQEKLLREYAQGKFEVPKVFRITESASKFQIRKTLGEMLKYAEKYGIHIILCEKIDRLTRSLKDAAIIDDWVHENETREVHFVKEHFTLNNHTKAHENFVWDMKVAVARFYTNNLSEEVRKGQKEKVAQGWLPTKPPLGYKTVGDKGYKTHVPDEAVSPLIKKLFEYYASGNYSVKALTEKMYDEGLRARGGGKVVKSRIHDLLCDPFYYGAMRWKDVVSAGKHEPLVSKEMFDRAQFVLRGGKTPHYKRRDFTFKKMMTCGECGGSITAEIQKGIVYYHCNHYRACTQKPFTQEKVIEEQILGVFKFFENITPAEAEELKAKIKADHSQEVQYKEEALRSLTEALKRLQKRSDMLYMDRLDSRISVERWENEQARIDSELGTVKEQITRLRDQEVKYYEVWLNILDLAHRARAIYQHERRTPEEKRLLLTHLFSNLTLKDKKLSYTLKKPVEVIAKRVQERLDAQKIFEQQKTLAPKGRKGSLPPKLSTLLRG